MENGGNDDHWRGQTSTNNNNNNVWWDLTHLGLGEEEMGTSQPFDCWSKRSNVGVVINSQDYDDDHHQMEEEEEEVMMMNPPITITNTNTNNNNNGGVLKQYHSSSSSSSLYAAGGSHAYPDPHLTCLKLGNTKRRQYYFEDGTSNIISAITTTTTTDAMGKKGKCCTTAHGVSLLRLGFGLGAGPGPGSSSTVVIPRCQVDGCHVELLCAREYHRRHKVCEVHSKATKVEVLGTEQRFCQQCSRFHVITEFDDSKRSCRRRLAGHNERRRKSNSSSSTSSSNDSTTTTSITSTTRKCFDRGGGGGLPHTKIPSSPRVCNAPSLLSTSGVSLSVDLLPSGVALHDPIAEKRVNIVHRQYSSSTTNWPKH